MITSTLKPLEILWRLCASTKDLTAVLKFQWWPRSILFSPSDTEHCLTREGGILVPLILQQNPTLFQLCSSCEPQMSLHVLLPLSHVTVLLLCTTDS